jgi:ribosome-binding factor A
MDSKRQQKFSRLIQRDLGEIFQRDAKSMFGNAMISVTNVRVSPDLGIAKIYLSFLMVNNPAEMLDYLELRKKEIRRILGNRIAKQVRIVPELVFYHDDSAEYSQKIDKILSNLHIPPADEEKPADD